MTKDMLTAQEEKELLEKFFAETRTVLSGYFDDRKIAFSNSQLFAFVLISPITIAIASDGNLDFSETTMLVDIAAYFDRDILPKELDNLSQPEQALSDKDFRRIIYSELRYLCLSMSQYESSLIQSIQNLIHLDEQISRDVDPRFSIKRRVVEMMNSVIYNNLGADSVEERKVESVLTALGIY